MGQICLLLKLYSWYFLVLMPNHLRLKWQLKITEVVHKDKSITEKKVSNDETIYFQAILKTYQELVPQAWSRNQHITSPWNLIINSTINKRIIRPNVY